MKKQRHSFRDSSSLRRVNDKKRDKVENNTVKLGKRSRQTSFLDVENSPEGRKRFK